MAKKKLSGCAEITHRLAEMGGGAKPKGGGMLQGLYNFRETIKLIERRKMKDENLAKGIAIGYAKAKEEDILRLKLSR